MGFTGGNAAVTYYKYASSAPIASMVVATDISDVTITAAGETIEYATREIYPNKATVAIGKTTTVDATIIVDPSSLAFLSACERIQFAQSTMSMAWLTGPYTVAGNRGPYGEFTVTSMTYQQPVEDIQRCDISFSLVEPLTHSGTGSQLGFART